MDGWKIVCKHLDDLAAEDHSYVATRRERERYKTAWTSSLNSHGSNTAPNRSRADYPEALATLRRKKEIVAGHKFLKHNWSRSPNSTAPMATIPAEKMSLWADHVTTGLRTSGTERLVAKRSGHRCERVAHPKRWETSCVLCSTRTIMGQLVVFIRLLVVRMARLALVVK